MRIQQISAQARIEGALVYLEDRKVWNTLPADLQDAAVQRARERLEPSFAYAMTDTYRCGGQTHRIATFRHQKTGMLFNLIPGGVFEMGSNTVEPDESPAHKVAIKPLLVGVCPVTERAWNGSASGLPVTNVSYHDVKAWLSEAGDGLRLLSESEWEYACRAGTTTKWSHGDDESSLKDYAWYDANAGETQPVGGREPNAFGLYDMHGNVWEWCEDDWIVSYASGPNDHLPRRKRGTAERAGRGGSWYNSARFLRSAVRFGCTPGGRSWILGARVARSI